MTIDLSGLPRRVSLTIGERIVIPLPSYADSGNTWSAMCLGGEEVARVTVKLGDLPPLPPALADGVAEPPPTHARSRIRRGRRSCMWRDDLETGAR